MNYCANVLTSNGITSATLQTELLEVKLTCDIDKTGHFLSLSLSLVEWALKVKYTSLYIPKAAAVVVNLLILLVSLFNCFILMQTFYEK